MVENYNQKILSVDDNYNNNLLIQSYLKSEGIHTTLAKDASEALELMVENHFCLFILDVHMININGYELAEKIREKEEYKLTPIIFITAFYFDEANVFKGYKSGATDYLFKPIKQEIICSKVKFFLALDKQKQDIINQKNELSFLGELLQNVNDSIIYTNLEGTIQYVNNGTNYTFGFKPWELINNTLSLIFPEQYKDLSIADLFVVIDFKPYESIWQGKNKTGDIIWLDVKINLMHTPAGKPEGYIVVSKDVTLQKKAETEVIRSIIKGEDNERKRIAFDLHDGLGQTLTAASLNFNSIKDDMSNLSSKKQNEYKLGLKFINMAIKEIRNIAHNLMPKSIEYFGLISAVKSLFTMVQNNSDFTISISENIDNKRLNSQIEIDLYRITQEILNNAIKHSKAKGLNFQYQVYDNELIFTYEDDGIGFDYDERITVGNGLTNIKNRVKAMSGFISINSKIGKGTSISIEIII